MTKFLVSIFTAIGFTVFALMVLVPVEKYILENYLDVSPLTGTLQGDWLLGFVETGQIVVLIALGFTSLWHFIGYFKFDIRSWTQSGGKKAWLLCLFLMLLVIAIFGYWKLSMTQDWGKDLSAFVFYPLNAIFVYWLASLIVSPSTVKYAPWGAINLAKWGIKRF